MKPDSTAARYGGLSFGVVVVDRQGRLRWTGTESIPNELTAVLQYEVGGASPPVGACLAR